MRKYIKLFVAAMLMVLLVTGCQKSAVSMQDDGVWSERNKSFSTDNGSDNDWYTKVSINVNKDMTEEDMLAVLDYYEKDLTENSPGEVENPVCYAIFYKGDTDEVLKEFKYCNGESVTVTDEDEKAHFSTMKLDDKAMAEENDEE